MNTAFLGRLSFHPSVRQSPERPLSFSGTSWKPGVEPKRFTSKSGKAYYIGDQPQSTSGGPSFTFLSTTGYKVGWQFSFNTLIAERAESTSRYR
jgi:hypothetical protein